MDLETAWPELANRSFVVTGASHGIGLAVARSLCRAGGSVVGLDQEPAAVEPGAPDEPGAAAYRHVHVDLSDRAAVHQVFSRLGGDVGPLAGLVNNAGAYERGTLATTDDQGWDRMLDLNLYAPFAAVRALRPRLVAEPGAAVVNVASIDGLRGHPKMAAYSIAKAGLIAAGRALADDLGRAGVRVNAVAPGGVATTMVTAHGGRLREDLEAATPLGRLGRPEEVAEVIVFLLSPRSSFMHGSTVTVDGGRSAITPGVDSMFQG